MQIKYLAILALIAQVICGPIVLVIYFNFHISTELAVLMQGISAAVVGKFLKLSRWWVIINLLFVPLIFFAGMFRIPSWMFLGGFVVLLLINWNSLKDRVPLYLTGSETLKKLEELLTGQKTGFIFVDLGSGLARTLYTLSKKIPESEFFGVETVPLVFVVSWARCLVRRNCHIRYRSIWNVDLSQYDVVYCFLSPVPMPALWEKTQKEMKKEAVLISNTFEVPGVAAKKVIELKDWRDSKIFIY